MTEGFVLVGGRSSRFGTDKALHEWQGQPLAVRAADTVRAAVGAVTLVGQPERYQHLGYTVLDDAYEGIGPLGGIVAALEVTTQDWVYVLSCDMPGVTVEFVKFLVDQQASEYDAIVPRQADARIEPACACYRAAVASIFRRAAEEGTYKLSRVVKELNVQWVEPEEWAPFDTGGQLFANINRLDDLAAFSS